MAMARSVLARVARGRHPASQPLLPAGAASELSLPSAGWRLQRHPAADHMSKRYLSGGKSECELVDSLRKKYFKVDGFYDKVDSPVYLKYTANRIQAISKDITAFKRNALIPVACVTASAGALWYYNYTLQKDLERICRIKLRISLIEHQRLGSSSPYMFVCHESNRIMRGKSCENCNAMEPDNCWWWHLISTT